MKKCMDNLRALPDDSVCRHVSEQHPSSGIKSEPDDVLLHDDCEGAYGVGGRADDLDATWSLDVLTDSVFWEAVGVTIC